MSNRDGKRSQTAQILVRDLKVVNQLGLHARPAALFVKAASRYESEITVEKDGNKVSGKSIMGLMTLEVGMGSVMKITADGTDAEDALDELQRLVESKFFEN